MARSGEGTSLLSAICRPDRTCDLHREQSGSPEKCPGCCDWGECRREATITVFDSEGSISFYMPLAEGREPLDDICLCVWHVVELAKRIEKGMLNVT